MSLLTRSQSPGFLLEGGQVFCSSTAPIGLGTQGLGEDAEAKARKLQQSHMKRYWEEREVRVREQNTREAIRLQRIADEQSKDSRRRLMELKAKREVEIREETEARKISEEEAKKKREQEAKEKNELIHAEKLLQQKLAKEAREKRLREKALELQAIHAKRSELLSVMKEEEEILQKAAEEHHTKLRNWHEVCRARAEAEAAERKKEREVVVKLIKETQQAKEKDHVVAVKEIVSIKAELIQEIQQDIKSKWMMTKAEREHELKHNAAAIKKAISTRHVEREKKVEAERQARIRSAERRKQEALAQKDEYLRGKDEHKKVLNAEAQLQKEKARQAIADEREAIRRDREERFELAKILVTRNSSHGRSGSSNRSPSPNDSRSPVHSTNKKA